MSRLLVSRLIAVAVLFFCAAVAAATWITWRADSAERRGDYATAIRWRPDAALYHRELAEQELVPHPAMAEAQLQAALARDPYDAVADQDLTMAELALGHNQDALANQRQAARAVANFTDLWSLANLEMARGDVAGFWRDAGRACALADDAAFTAIVARTLTFTHYDFAGLKAILPPANMAAAAAFLHAALARADESQAASGFAWLVQTHTGSLDTYMVQRSMADEYLQQAWKLWPADVPAIWDVGRRAQLMNGPDKDANQHIVVDGDFEAANTDPLQLTPAMGWQASPLLAQRRVVTGKGDYPSAVGIEFQLLLGANPPMPLPQELTLDEQWILAPGGRGLMATFAGKRDGGSGISHAISLRLVDRGNHVLAELPIALGEEWKAARGEWKLPAGPVGAYRLQLHYARPLGEEPLVGTVFVSGVRLTPEP